MSNPPESSLDLEDLELQLLPAWARQAPEPNRYAGFRGEDSGTRPSDRFGRGDRRGPRPDRDRPRDRGPLGRGQPRQDRGGRPMGGGDRRAGQFRREERPEPAPLEVNVSFTPEEKGVESIARQIKLTGRAYPIFDIARLALRKPERYHVTFSTWKRPDGQVAQALWTCNLDDTLWLSELEAIDHVLRKHFETFYQAEKVATEAPKGTYTFVAQCGLSGEILGPPNLNEVQVRMRKLHAERYSSMPFEVYKARVRIVKDEVSVKKWIEEKSWKTEYQCLNIPEPKKLSSREEVEKHFREVHVANIIRSVESHTLNGKAAQQLPSQPLRALLRRAWDEQSRFPIRLVTVLSQQFASHGLQFFKVNKTVTHVAVARPHFLDVQVTPVSDGIARIVGFINATPQCTRKKLLDALAPSPAPVAVSSSPDGAEPVVPAEGAVPPGPSAVGVATTATASPTPEQTAIIADLHWLIHQGHVLEFANGRMETAKRPLPKPAPRPAPPVARPAAPAANSIAGSEPAAGESTGDSSAASGVTESAAPDMAATPVESGQTVTPLEVGDLPSPDPLTGSVQNQSMEAPGEPA